MNRSEGIMQEKTRRSVGGFVALTKPGLTLVSVSTAVGGTLLALGEALDYYLLINVFIGAYLAGAGAGALNQFMERNSDARMTRTGLRPLPSKRISPRTALLFGAALAASGILYLVIFTSAAAGIIASCTLIIYLAVYTPMKRKTPAALYAGGIAGALPPLIGWTASGSKINVEALSLFLILFIWQIPHFLSLAWLYRGDYARAGYRVITVTDPAGISAGRQILYACILLVPASLLPAYTGNAGIVYAITALLMSFLFLAAAYIFFRNRSEKTARKLFQVSIIYIPVLYIVLILN